MPLNATCDYTVAILDCSDVAQPFIITNYPALLIEVTARHYHHANNVSGSHQVSMQ